MWSMPETPDSETSIKPFDAFQRRKIGSLRDNNKLSKILQQFENGGKEDDDRLNLLSTKTKGRAYSDSAPCSFTSRINVDRFFQPDAKITKAVAKIASSPRRHSEGEIIDQKFLKKNLIVNSQPKQKPLVPTSNIYSNFQPAKLQKNDKTSQPYSPKYGHKDNYSKIQLPPTHQQQRSLDTPFKSSTKKDIAETPGQVDNPPPIPRRGLSLPVTNIMNDMQVFMPKKKLSPTSSTERSPSSPKTIIKQDSVKRAIQMYEGLSSKLSKTSKSRRSGNYPKVTLKKDMPSTDSYVKRTSLSRKSSKRNSFHASKNAEKPSVSKKENLSPTKTNNQRSHCKYSKEDSGIGFSDSDDLKSPQGIYQTLCSIQKDEKDMYDRLNRIHDAVNRIHKGQSSTCAACKAIPTSSLQLPKTAGPCVVHVKCNELSPHHHPPCICFSCQHSIFSCSENTTPLDLSLSNLSLSGQEENLYYNVCCLTGPNCEGWRRSRRRPVCEQNGRLCVVNCDMERRQKNKEEFYEKIFEWNTEGGATDSVTLIKQSCDSCDSDEGWVDVTDSEDEKMMSASDSSLTVTPKTSCTSQKISLVRENSEPVSIHNMSYDAESMCNKMGCDSISHASSTEHLYETIADLEAHNGNVNDLGEKSLDNEPDSGEWSTESSSSPTPGEPANPSSTHHKQSLTASAPPSKFTVASHCDYHDTTKKTFIKTVLGKKSLTPKKRRMSHFFVPWLVSNQEYHITRSPKATMKKQSTKTTKTESASHPGRAISKNQRSQSIPSCTSASLSTRKIFSSTEILDRCKSDMKELEQMNSSCSEDNFGLPANTIETLSERGSLASSTYVRADQLHSNHHVPMRQRSSVPEDSDITDVSVEKIFRRSSSRESLHSYIVFRPIKEEEVPLYQFYERNTKERVSLCRSPESMSPIMWSSTLDVGPSLHESSKSSLMKPQLSVVEQLSPNAKDIKMLWCELPEVKESGILERISAQELKLQEAEFEFIQSQASFIRSLQVLYKHFISMPEFSDTKSSVCVLSKHEHDVLFSDIVIVKEVSECLMADLAERWSEGIMIPDIGDIIYRHATMPSFSSYVKYCSNRLYQEKTLKELKDSRLCFLEALRKLESNPACQGLSLESFLFLPMQHIARLPFLLDNIFRWLSPDSPSMNTCKQALEALHKIFMECNEGARKMERLEEMFILNKQLEFKECKVIPLISASRWLLKRGELVKLEFDKKTFGRTNRCLRVPLYIFLFNDLLVITKKKNDDSYTVLDYCQRDKVQAIAADAKDLQQPDLVPSNCRYLLYLTLFSNHQGTTIDIILNCMLQSERTRWIEAIHPVSTTKAKEVWEYDSPQVQCVRSYIAQQPDELSLQESDVVTIHRKMNDGWYEGRRLRDGSQGWFPASYTMDIPCSIARASNLRQCYRLLMLSQKHESTK